MLKPIAPDLWHLPHSFVTNGLRIATRMTVVRFRDGSLWLHSPVPLDSAVRTQLAELGTVRYIVAPNKMHHLFAGPCAAAFPDAKLYGAPGLAAKRPGLRNLHELGTAVEPEWRDELEQIFFEGIPAGNESVWLHKASGTLILTDLCQWWPGEQAFATRLYASLTGVRERLAVPRTIRLLVKDRAAARASAQRILAWPFTRVVMAHTEIVEHDAHRAMEAALAVWTRG